MKKTGRIALRFTFYLIATLALTRWWLRHPDAFPRFPTPFWIWLNDLYGTQNAEQAADLAILVGLGLWLCVVVLVAVPVEHVWRRWRRGRTAFPSSP